MAFQWLSEKILASRWILSQTRMFKECCHLSSLLVLVLWNIFFTSSCTVQTSCVAVGNKISWGALPAEGALPMHITAPLWREGALGLQSVHSHPRQCISSSAALTKTPGNQAMQLPCPTFLRNSLYQPVAILAGGDMRQHIQIHVPWGKLVIAQAGVATQCTSGLGQMCSPALAFCEPIRWLSANVKRRDLYCDISHCCNNLGCGNEVRMCTLLFSCDLSPSQNEAPELMLGNIISF